MYRSAAVDPQKSTISADGRGALRPERADRLQPLFEHGPKTAGAGIFNAAKLLGESERAKERDRLGAFRDKTPIAQPHEQVQERWRGCEHFDCFEVGGNGMAGDLGIEFVAESNCILACWRAARVSLVGWENPLSQDSGERRLTDNLVPNSSARSG